MNANSASRPPSPSLDAQYAELMETVWGCEAQWTLDDRLDATLRYARRERYTTTIDVMAAALPAPSHTSGGSSE